MKRFFAVAGVAFLLMAGGTLYLSRDVPWAPRADFDVLGILWLLSNVPKLGSWGIAALFLFLAGWCFLWALGVRVSRFSRLSARSEEARMLADPRFHQALKRPDRE